MPTMYQCYHRYATDGAGKLRLVWPPEAILVTDGAQAKVIGDTSAAMILRWTLMRRFKPGHPEDVLFSMVNRLGQGIGAQAPVVDGAPLQEVVRRLRAQQLSGWPGIAGGGVLSG